MNKSNTRNRLFCNIAFSTAAMAFSLHYMKRTSFRAVVFSMLGMPRNHMVLSLGYKEDVLVLFHQFQSVLPMPQQQYVAGNYPGAKTTVS
jgi:hypothetical protein